MKTTILAILFTLSAAFAQEDPIPIEKKLQQALFAEEGTRDLDKAIEAYNAVIADYDKQRKFAATAIFRLAECHRKKDQKEKAIAFYQRLLKEFPGEETLTRLAEENLIALGATATEAGDATVSSSEPGEIARIKQLVALSPDLINDPETGLLHKAAAESQLEVAKFLIESGADINLVSRGDTPLAPAAGGGHLAMTELLLSKGAKLTKRAFSWAVMNQRTAVVDRLLEAHKQDDSELLTDALRSAAGAGRADYLKKLLAKGAAAEHLGMAIAKGSLECVRLLLDAGATPDDAEVVLAVRGSGIEDQNICDQVFELVWEKSSKPAMAIRVALEEVHRPQRALQIINSLEDIEAEGGLGTTPLGYVAYINDPKLVRAVLARGADPNAKDSTGSPPLVWSVFAEIKKEWSSFDTDLTEIVDLLLDAGAEIDARNANGDSAITIAGWGKSIQGASSQPLPDAAVERILAAKPDPLQLNPEKKSLTSASNSRVRIYALLGSENRGDKVWTIKLRARDYRGVNSSPLRLSQVLIDAGMYEKSITLYEPGGSEPKTIDYNEILATDDPAKDPLLQLGTMVILPDEPSADPDPVFYDFLQRAAAKDITINHGEHQWRGEARPGQRPEHPYDPSQRIAYATTVKGLLSAIYAPMDRSDLSRIEVQHADGESSMLNALAADLDLRDGDHIVLPPVRSSAASPGSIRLTRESDLFHLPLVKGTGPDGRFPNINFAELLAAAYSSSQFVLSTPDLTKITLQSGNETTVVSLEDLEVGALSALIDGSVINIPSLPEPDAKWTNLDEGATAKLAQLLARTAKFEIHGGATREAKVGPQFYHFPLAANGLRSIESLSVPSDKEFEVLGLSAATAIRNLGYVPTDNLEVLYKLESLEAMESGGPIAPRSYLTVHTHDHSLFPIISPGALVTVQMRGISTPRKAIVPTRRPPPSRAVPQSRAPAPAPGQALIDARNKANATNSPRPGPNPRASGRRVVLPPKSK